MIGHSEQFFAIQNISIELDDIDLYYGIIVWRIELGKKRIC